MFETRIEGQVRQLIPIIFPSFLAFEEVAKGILSVKPEFRVSSAGELDVKVSGVGGDSETLNVLSQPVRDKLCISQIDYLSGVEL